MEVEVKFKKEKPKCAGFYAFRLDDALDDSYTQAVLIHETESGCFCFRSDDGEWQNSADLDGVWCPLIPANV